MDGWVGGWKGCCCCCCCWSFDGDGFVERVLGGGIRHLEAQVGVQCRKEDCEEVHLRL